MTWPTDPQAMRPVEPPTPTFDEVEDVLVTEELDKVTEAVAAAWSAITDEHEGNLRDAVYQLRLHTGRIRVLVEGW